MPFNGVGQWSNLFSWVNQAANAVPISAPNMDAQFSDIAQAGFDNCVTRDGQGVMGANFVGATDATYDLGSMSVQWNNLYLSGSIFFAGGAAVSQTVAAWVPTDNSGAGLTFTNVQVNYTRQGNLVNVYGHITFPVVATTAPVSIGGLPIASANQPFVIGVGGYANDGSGSTRFIQMNQNASTFGVINSARGLLTNNQLSGAQLDFAFFYPVT